MISGSHAGGLRAWIAAARDADRSRVYKAAACLLYTVLMLGYVLAFSSTRQHLVSAMLALIACTADVFLVILFRCDRAKTFASGIVSGVIGICAIVSIFF